MGIAACVLIVVAWGVSLRWHATRYGPGPSVLLAAGNVRLIWFSGQRVKTAFTGWRVYPGSPGILRYGFSWPYVALAPFPYASTVRLPLWLPLLVIAIPTAILWHRDRRRIPPGHCQSCGYNLTGNVSGKCPECGTGVGGKPE
jgi:hypothetical protein